MELELIRTTRTENSTIGKLSITESESFRRKSEQKKYPNPVCFILEDYDRGLTQDMPMAEIRRIKVHGKTAIPAGRYQIVATMSTRFGVVLPILINVPGFEGIRIHPGNAAKDTEGCLLPGIGQSTDFVTQSKLAFDVLFNIMRGAWRNNEQVWITIH